MLPIESVENKKIIEFIENNKKRLGESKFNQRIFAELMNRDPGYVSKIIKFKAVPSLMMSLVLEILSDGKVKPWDLVTADQLKKYLKANNICLTKRQINKYKK